MTDRIERFTGEYRFLSNFFPARVYYEKEEYPSVEHAYQAAKSSQPKVREAIRNAPTAALARSLGRHVVMDAKDWDNRKVDVMLHLLRQKFTRYSNLEEKLLATADAYLIEGNTWGDRFWGAVNGKGKNMLGTLLVIVRYEARLKKERGHKVCLWCKFWSTKTKVCSEGHEVIEATTDVCDDWRYVA